MKPLIGIGGRFILFPDTPKQLIIENNVLDEGEISFLKMICQDDQTDVPGGSDFYIGLCGAAFDEDDTLATLVGEPSGAGGYARKAVERSNVGWPTIGEINGIKRAQTLTVTWSPSAANYDEPIRRFFLCNVASGTAGLLFSVSGPLPADLTFEDGSNYPVRYELYLR